MASYGQNLERFHSPNCPKNVLSNLSIGEKACDNPLQNKEICDNASEQKLGVGISFIGNE
jgi:hypothetical protein